MASKSLRNVASTHAIFQVALAEDVPATYARTLAECLYWSQHTKHRIDGRPALYKTGAELSQKLGLAARTINSHLKKLAKGGFWHIEYRPRPSHPSPVTWLVISERSAKLLADAAADNRRKTRSSTLDRTRPVSSKEQTCDIQALQDATTYRDINTGDEIEEPSFVSDRYVRRNEPSREGEDKVRAPRYVRASRELEELISAVSRILEGQGLEPWDTVSRHTWEHGRELLEKLLRFGCESLSDQVQLISEIFRNWSDLRFVMDGR